MSPKTCLAIAITLASSAPLGMLGDAAEEPSVTPLPQLLSDAGLFVAGSMTEVRPELLPFSPQYPLWSDGATKRRWIELPPHASVDASRPDAWEFPRGTKLWKEFTLGRRVETRMIERLRDGSWRYATYVWKEDGSDAVLAPPEGIQALSVKGAPEGRYAIPSETDCRACHEGAAVPVLGFSALQLSPDRDPLAPHSEPARADHMDLRKLVARGLLRNLPPSLSSRPPRIEAASSTERAALGYLHANCGHCHASPDVSDAAAPVDVQLAQPIPNPATADRIRRSLAGVPSRYRISDAPNAVRIIDPGKPQHSILLLRMRSRDPRVQMPPLGTATPDTEALTLLERWMNEIPPST